MVSSRAVSMDESFPKPVVIGYDGFSFSISKNPITSSNGVVHPVTFGEYISESKLQTKLNAALNGEPSSQK
jgi:hypothetical protein